MVSQRTPAVALRCTAVQGCSGPSQDQRGIDSPAGTAGVRIRVGQHLGHRPLHVGAQGRPELRIRGQPGVVGRADEAVARTAGRGRSGPRCRRASAAPSSGRCTIRRTGAARRAPRPSTRPAARRAAGAGRGARTGGSAPDPAGSARGGRWPAPGTRGRRRRTRTTKVAPRPAWHPPEHLGALGPTSRGRAMIPRRAAPHRSRARCAAPALRLGPGPRQRTEGGRCG